MANSVILISRPSRESSHQQEHSIQGRAIRSKYFSIRLAYKTVGIQNKRCHGRVVIDMGVLLGTLCLCTFFVF